jgi:NAD(P)-dependent dehydrogenase (short-subunit alcohol dehydrogenase family)
LDGKVAIVTGGSQGIGKATAAELLDAGASVMIGARLGEPDILVYFEALSKQARRAA